MSRRSRYGRYHIVAPLAHGGMSEVLLARYRDPHGAVRSAAVKVVAERLRGEPSITRQLRHEAQVLHALRHPNVVCGIDAGGVDYFAMELLSGLTVRGLMQLSWDRRREIPLGVALYVAWSAASGLHAAHELRDTEGTLVELVHRDVAPENLFVSPDGVVKVIDFGIADSRVNHNRVPHPLLAGRPGYAAPELGRRWGVDRRADVYGIGVVLYELVTGARPPATGLRAPLPDYVSPGLRDLLDTALAPNPNDRFPTAAHMQLALARAAAETGEPIGPEQVAAFVGSDTEDRPLDLDTTEFGRIELTPADPTPVEDVGTQTLSDTATLS